MTIWHILGFVVFTMLSAYLASNPKSVFSRITDNRRALLATETAWCQAHGIDMPVAISDEQPILGIVSSAFAFGTAIFAVGDILESVSMHPALVALSLLAILGASILLWSAVAAWWINTWILTVVFRHNHSLQADSVKRHLDRNEWFQWNMMWCNVCNPISYVLSLLMLVIRSRVVISLHKNRTARPKEAAVKQSWSDKWYNAVIDRAKHDQD